MKYKTAILNIVMLLSSSDLLGQLIRYNDYTSQATSIYDSLYTEELIIGVNWQMLDCRRCVSFDYSVNYLNFNLNQSSIPYYGPFFVIFNSNYSLEKVVSNGIFKLSLNLLSLDSSVHNNTQGMFIYNLHEWFKDGWSEKYGVIDPWIKYYTNINRDSTLTKDSLNAFYRKFRPQNFPNVYRIPYYGIWNDSSSLWNIGVATSMYWAVFKCKILYEYLRFESFPLINVYCKNYGLDSYSHSNSIRYLPYEEGLCELIPVPFFRVLSIDSIEPVNLPPYSPYDRETDTIYSFK